MSYPAITVIAVDLKERSKEILEPIHRMVFLRDSEIHFVHNVTEISYSGESLLKDKYPGEDTKPLIEVGIISKMKEMAKILLPYGHMEKVKFHCIFGDDPKRDFVKFSNSMKADLVIVATQEEHNIFHSSFSYFVGMNAEANVFVLRAIKDKIRRFKGHERVLYGVKLQRDNSSYPSLESFEFLKEANIQLLHISPLMDYRFIPEIEFAMLPTSEAQIVIEEALRHKMDQFVKRILPRGFVGICTTACTFASDVRREFAHYANNMNADLVVLNPDNKKRLGGFIQYQLTHCQADILLLKR